MAQNTYGTQAWTLEEIRDKFLVYLQENADSKGIRVTNAQIAQHLQSAIYQQQVASRKESNKKAIMEAKKDEETIKVARAEQAKGRGKALTADERAAEVRNKIRTEIQEHDAAAYELVLWNRVVDSLKGVAKRVDTASMLEAVDSKMKLQTKGQLPVEEQGGW